MFSNTFAGIAPSSVAPFVGCQVVGGAIALIAIAVLYPDAAAVARRVVMPHESGDQHSPVPQSVG